MKDFAYTSLSVADALQIPKGSASDDPGSAAKPGFDACTGWGTPIGDKLFEALVNLGDDRSNTSTQKK